MPREGGPAVPGCRAAAAGPAVATTTARAGRLSPESRVTRVAASVPLVSEWVRGLMAPWLRGCNPVNTLATDGPVLEEWLRWFMNTVDRLASASICGLVGAL